MSLFSPKCPQCHEGKLFASLLRVVDRCSHCGLELGGHDAGDGPAFFAITIVGFIVMAGAGVVEYHYEPPMWVHAAVWIPLTFILCIWLLRVFKALLIGLQLKTKRLGDDA